MTKSSECYGISSDIYRAGLSKAIIEARKIGFIRNPMISEKAQILENDLIIVTNLVNDYSSTLDNAVPGY